MQQYYERATHIPREILLSHPIDEAEVVDTWLRSLRHGAVSIMVPRIGEKRRLVEMVMDNAREKLEEFYRRLVNVADQEWDRGLKVNISDLHRSAGRHFKLNKPWLPDLRPKKECPVCAESIPVNAAICKGCNAVLDQELAAKGIIARARSWKGLAEEQPDAYKDVDLVVEVVHRAGLARKVARMRPIGVVKG